MAMSDWTSLCPKSILTGGLLGAAAGGGFHILGSTIVRAQGRTTLKNKHVWRETGAAALRIGTVLAGYTTIRCTMQRFTKSELLPRMVAGGLAVAAATALDPARIKFLEDHYKTVFRQLSPNKKIAVPLHLVLVSSAASGAFVFGGIDYAVYKLFGLTW